MKNVFDTHCHLFSNELYPKAEELLETAYKEGLRGLCLITTNKEDLKRSRELSTLAQKYPDFHLIQSSGLHPHEAQHFSLEICQEIEERLREAKAVGETGLDFYYDFSDKKQQLEAFEYHIECAKKYQKPLIIHSREAHRSIMDALKAKKIQELSKPGILHCFTGTWEEAKECLDLGLKISFSGILTFKRSEELRSVAQKVPLKSLLVETDAPYLAPMPYRGRENQPAWVIHSLDVLCKIRPEEDALIREQVWKNSLDIFSL